MSKYATRDCPHCKRATNTLIEMNDKSIDIKCQECGTERTLPRIPTVVRQPFIDGIDGVID